MRYGTLYLLTLSEKNRATAVGNANKHLVGLNIGRLVLEICLRTNRHAQRHVDRHTFQYFAPLYRGGSSNIDARLIG